MSLTEYSFIFDVLSAISVVISILYLGYQIRQNTRAIRRTVARDIVRDLNELGGFFIEMPDLIITDVDREYGVGQMYITIQNIGEAAIADQPLTLQLETSDGRVIPGVFPASFDIPQLEFWESTVLEWDMSVHSSPENLDDGYTVIINADYSIAEVNEDNNTYEVPANPEFVFFWGSVELRWYPLSAFDICEPSDAYDAELQTQTLSLSLQAVSPFGNRSLGSLSEEYEIEYPGLHFIGTGESGPSVRFDLDGTEVLTAMITGEARRGASTEELGTVWWTPKGEDVQWGATQFEANLEYCSIISHDVVSPRTTIYPPDTRRYNCGPWYFYYLICQRATE